MGATDELALFAQLGAAFAGFIAIFLIFARREGRFSAADSLRIRSIILASFSAVFFSLVPLVLHHAGFSGAGFGERPALWPSSEVSWREAWWPASTLPCRQRTERK